MISKTVLVLSEGFGDGLDAERVVGAIARGLTANGHLETDLCPLEGGLGARTDGPAAPLDEAGFDLRMRAARAVVLACVTLDDRTLAGSVAFEAATR
ncbi:MAG: hypothetical protein ACRDJ3_06780, partial [Solirubrobacteraceae bacterium]